MSARPFKRVVNCNRKKQVHDNLHLEQSILFLMGELQEVIFEALWRFSQLEKQGILSQVWRGKSLLVRVLLIGLETIIIEHISPVEQDGVDEVMGSACSLVEQDDQCQSQNQRQSSRY